MIRGGSAIRRNTAGIRQGFTLFELLLVLSLAGVVMALVVPRLDNQVSAARFDRLVSDLVGGLKHARSAAIAASQESGVRFDLEDRQYQIEGIRGGTEKKFPERVHVKVTTGRSEIVGSSVGAIRFYPDGTSTGGQIELTHPRKRVVIGITWLTGAVQVHEATLE